MAGETDLSILIANMEPVLNEGEYVFVSVSDLRSIPKDNIISQIKEKEGITVILSKENADALGLKYDFIAAWITLHIHSSLDAVGLTAAFSTALAENGISCNVVAGYYHDHIFVDSQDGIGAMNTLRSLAKRNAI